MEIRGFAEFGQFCGGRGPGVWFRVLILCWVANAEHCTRLRPRYLCTLDVHGSWVMEGSGSSSAIFGRPEHANIPNALTTEDARCQARVQMQDG